MSEDKSEAPADIAAQDPTEPVSRPPWSAWAGLGWTLLILVLSNFISALVMVGYLLIVSEGKLSLLKGRHIGIASSYGFLMSLCSFIMLPPTIFFISWLVRMRNSGLPREYLGWVVPKLKHVFAWAGILSAYLPAEAGFFHLIHRNSVPEFMKHAWNTAGSHVLLVMSVGLAFPFFEEILIRGFLFRSFLHSRMGATGTILATSLIWTVFHIQYGLYENIIVFGMGILLGLARYKSGSTMLSFFLHAGHNLMACLTLAFMS